jgi:hypothetical protein
MGPEFPYGSSESWYDFIAVVVVFARSGQEINGAWNDDTRRA